MVIWRVELSDDELVLRFPWRQPVTLAADDVVDIAPHSGYRLPGRTSQWMYLTTTSGTRFRLWTPKRRRATLLSLRDELLARQSRQAEDQGKTL